MRILGNVVVNLRATGPATVLVTWIVCITLLGLFGDGPHAKTVIGVLSALGGVLVGALSSRT
jgi:hypothetical protein